HRPHGNAERVAVAGNSGTVRAAQSDARFRDDLLVEISSPIGAEAAARRARRRSRSAGDASLLRNLAEVAAGHHAESVRRMRTIAHISDLHFGTEDPQIAAALREDLCGLGPSLVVVSGDLTQRAKPAEFLAAREFLSTIPQPQIVVPGNHDIPLYNLLRRAF